MRRHRPSAGASSIAPFSLMHSACTPRAAKWRRVMLGILGGDADVAPARRIVARRPAPPARPPTGGSGRCRGRPARRSPDSRIPSARRCRRRRSAPRRRRRRWRRRSAHADDVEPGIVGGEAQLARVLVGEGRPPARCRRARAAASASARMRPLGRARTKLARCATLWPAGLIRRTGCGAGYCRAGDGRGRHCVGQGSPRSSSQHGQAARPASRIAAPSAKIRRRVLPPSSTATASSARNAVALLQVEAAQLHALDPLDADAGEGAAVEPVRRRGEDGVARLRCLDPLVGSRRRHRLGRRLPAEAVGHQDEAPLAGQVGHVVQRRPSASCRQRGDHRQILGVAAR